MWNEIKAWIDKQERQHERDVELTTANEIIFRVVLVLVFAAVMVYLGF